MIASLAALVAATDAGALANDAGPRVLPTVCEMIEGRAARRAE